MKKINNKTILVSGGNGFLGSFVVKELKKEGKNNKIITINSKEFDLSKEESVKKIFKKFKKVDYVIHLASAHGGLYYNIKNCGDIYYKNILMNTYLMHHSALNNVKKFLSAGTVDAYPKNVKTPWKETDLWKGYPEETSSAYAFSKKMLIVQGLAYKKQYGLNAIHLLFMNLYGPHDQFDLKKSHVIPAIIKKIFIAKQKGKKKIDVYGTGMQKREFLYVEDAANSILLALKKYSSCKPLNIGTGRSHTISEVVNTIIKLINYKIIINWKKNIETGISKKSFNVLRAKKEIGFSYKVDLKEGLKNTIDWYKIYMKK
jgi:GDP-L-fucose synthase